MASSLDSSDDDAVPLEQHAESPDAPLAVLVSALGDTRGEKAKWILDKHHYAYVDCSYPYPLHVLHPYPTLLDVPSLVLSDQQVIGDQGSAQISLWVAQHSAGGAGRSLLGQGAKQVDAQSVLELEDLLDRELYPLATRVFYTLLLSSPALMDKYLVRRIHLRTWKSLFRVAAPLLIPWLNKRFAVPTAAGLDAMYAQVEQIFQHIESLLNISKRRYLLDDHVTSADIAFASHCLPILLLGDDDSDSADSNFSFGVPAMAELKQHLPEALHKVVADRVSKLRGRRAGQLAARLFARRPRGTRVRLPSRHDRRNNPWWSHILVLSVLVYGAMFGLLLLWGTLITWTIMDPTARAFGRLVGLYVLQMALAFPIVRALKTSALGKRIDAFNRRLDAGSSDADKHE
ncbi:hypothetical protein RI367_007827 [Sorochytrium milnesiophthora]